MKLPVLNCAQRFGSEFGLEAYRHIERNDDTSDLILGLASSFGADSRVLPNLLTPLSADQAAKALSDGYKKVVGRKPSKSILDLLISQTALETGNWKSLHNYNFGNAKATSSDQFVQYYGCSEVFNGVEEFFSAGDPHCVFAAHKTAADGAAHYINVLKSRAHWWTGLQSGTVPKFIAGLTTVPAYFTADAGQYGNTLSKLTAQYAPLAKKYSGSTFLQVLGGIALGAGALASVSQLRKRV
jgi:hypothetical protein